MSMITNAKSRSLDKSVLLFSGGMDSLIYDFLLKPDILLYIPSNTAYSNEENRCITKLVAQDYINSSKLIHVPNVLDLSAYERDDLIVPNRNAHLVLLASNYGEEIYLASVSGDRSFDKDPEFFRLITNLLNHMWQEQHWTEKREFSVSSPYKNFTKTALVKMYLRAGGASDALFTSYSCYKGEEKHCGICKPCARKRVALENNGLSCEGYFQQDFWKSDWFLKLLPTIQKSQYRGSEDLDFMRFLRSCL